MGISALIAAIATVLVITGGSVVYNNKHHKQPTVYTNQYPDPSKDVNLYGGE